MKDAEGNSGENIMYDILEMTMLYDFYGELLTGKQRRVFEDYFMRDFSLNEIAENMDVSRQAVSVLLMRVKAKLRDYEKKVGFIAFYNSVNNKNNDRGV